MNKETKIKEEIEKLPAGEYTIDNIVKIINHYEQD